jgi:hypothetical protein
MAESLLAICYKLTGDKILLHAAKYFYAPNYMNLLGEGT